MNNEQERRISVLERFVESLKSSARIPLEVDAAFRTRLTTSVGASASSKSATSENEFIDEGGVSTHQVLKAPDGFVQIFINNTAYFIPYYS